MLIVRMVLAATALSAVAAAQQTATFPTEDGGLISANLYELFTCPYSRTAIPNQQQRFKLRDTVNLVDNKANDFAFALIFVLLGQNPKIFSRLDGSPI